MKKNDIVTISITDLNDAGEGIGKADGYTLFVKGALIGDEAEVKVMKAKKTYGYARLMRIVHPSEHRIEPKCPVASPCGGCQLQAMAYGEQLAFKERKVKNALIRLGGVPQEIVETVMEPICGLDEHERFRYRNKAQYPVGYDREGNCITGFYAGHTHCIIPNTDCLLAREENKEILEAVLDFMKRCRISAYREEQHTGLMRHVLTRYAMATGEWMVCLVINGDDLPHKEKLVEKLRNIKGMTSIVLSANKEKTNVILGKKTTLLWGQGYITDKIGEVSYQISPLSFYQVNPFQTKRLYETALSYAALTGNETVWDLYCGIGTISLFLAKNAKHVHGVEIVPQAIEDARKNAKINNIDNAIFTVGKAEEVLPAYYAEHPRERADVIVVDPPRKGCEEAVLETMVRMEPERIVYVSCDPATLARDVKYLRERGYELRRARAHDMFAWGVHVETVCLLSKLNTKQHIEVDIYMDELDLTDA